MLTLPNKTKFLNIFKKQIYSTFLNLLVVLLFACKNKHPKIITNLAKYSYYIVGFATDSTIIEGSCFFMKSGAKTYLITAKHIIAPFDSLCNKVITIDYLQINLPRANNMTHRKTAYLKIKKIQDAISCPINLDVIAIEIQNAEKYSLNTIESYLPRHIPETIDSMIIYGFPRLKSRFFVNYLRGGVFLLSPQSEILSNKINFNDTIDTISYNVKANGISVDYLRDFSGSPVFVRDKSTGSWVFLGCWGTSYVPGKYIKVIKPSVFFTETYTKYL